MSDAKGYTKDVSFLTEVSEQDAKEAIEIAE